MHKFPAIASALTLCAAALEAAEFRMLDRALLGELRSEAARSHPAALAASDQAQAATHEVRAVRLWDDPMLELGIMAASKMMRMDDGDAMIGLEQPLPQRGMFAAEREKMRAMQRAAIESAGDAALGTGALASKAAIELALADESIALQQSQVEWLAAMAENARQMAADPMGSAADALRMETELEMER